MTFHHRSKFKILSEGKNESYAYAHILELELNTGLYHGEHPKIVTIV